MEEKKNSKVIIIILVIIIIILVGALCYLLVKKDNKKNNQNITTSIITNKEKRELEINSLDDYVNLVKNNDKYNSEYILEKDFIDLDNSLEKVNLDCINKKNDSYELNGRKVEYKCELNEDSMDELYGIDIKVDNKISTSVANYNQNFPYDVYYINKNALIEFEDYGHDPYFNHLKIYNNKGDEAVFVENINTLTISSSSQELINTPVFVKNNILYYIKEDRAKTEEPTKCKIFSVDLKDSISTRLVNTFDCIAYGYNY